MTTEKCTSCKGEISNMKGSTRFKCPNCVEHDIIRCYDCRKRGTKYTCPKCEFEGPN